VSRESAGTLDELKRHLLCIDRSTGKTVWTRSVDAELPVRIPIDRAFHLKGLGVVVTGTLVSGRVRTGDTLAILPGDGKARIRSLQVHGEAREVALAGERTALQISGVQLEEVRRGLQLVSAGEFATSHRLIGRLTLLDSAPKPLTGSTVVRFHLYSSELLGRVRPLQGPLRPGQSGEVEIRLSRPVVAVRGDRFIVRRPSPPTTLGGGEILDPHWHRHRASEIGATLEAFTGGLADALSQWIRESQEAGIDTTTLAQRTGENRSLIEQTLADLESDQVILRVESPTGGEPRWLAPETVRQVEARAREVLRDYFKRQRLAEGMPRAEAVERLLPRRAADLAPVYLRWLEAEKVLVVEGGRVKLPGRSAQLTGEESQLAQAIVGAYVEGGLRPAPPAEICTRLGAKPQIFEGVVRYLTQKGDLHRLPGGLLISANAIEEVVAEIRGLDDDKITVGDFKRRFGLSRKWAIPILEYLDSAGVTKRIGDQRLITRST
jgi:selenocysteine-specific elongation factor